MLILLINWLILLHESKHTALSWEILAKHVLDTLPVLLLKYSNSEVQFKMQDSLSEDI